MLRRLKYLVQYGAYIPTEYFVRKDKEAVYVPIPKVASTSIKECFFEAQEGLKNYPDYMDVHHQRAGDSLCELDAAQRRYFKFAFVRNPFDRLVSCYQDKVKREFQHNGRYYFDSSYARWVLRAVSGVEFEPSMTFRQFVVAVSRVPDRISDGHFRSQYHYLFNLGSCAPDYIGKFENIDRDWEIVRQRLGLGELSLRNETTRLDPLIWYDSLDLLEMVRHRYTRDVETWYQPEYEYLRCSLAGK